jgi:carboxymethylenebutenolidase
MDRRIIALYDQFTHGGMDRREFMARLAVLAGGATAAAAIAPALENDYSGAGLSAAESAPSGDRITLPRRLR